MMSKTRVITLIITVFVLLFPALLWAGTIQLPDTGQTACYDMNGNVIPCTGTGQDGAYTINPMSFTDNGNGTITDNNTGLMWQKEDDNTTYSWYQASGTFDATYNPSSQDVCGSLTLGGDSDWRLPEKKELMTIINYSIPYPGPTIDPIFSNTKSADYWSSTTTPYYPSSAWSLGFGYGYVGGSSKYLSFYVRCVRGEKISGPNLIDNGNGTVTDNRTGLVWQQGETGHMAWDSALSYCDGLSLGGDSDWRLPNIKELESLTDDAKYGPAIDINFFPNATASLYWSSTTYAYDPGFAWCVHFDDSFVWYLNKAALLYVRCVSGGQVGPSDGLVAYWSFDNCDATDDSGNGHDGTIYGNPQCVDGEEGKAIHFDNPVGYTTITQYVTMPYSQALSNLENSSFTISILYKSTDTVQQNGRLFGNGGPYYPNTGICIDYNAIAHPQAYSSISDGLNSVCP